MEKETYRQLFPSRNTFIFEDGLEVTSDFDSGNLSKCVMTSSPNKQASEQVYSFEFWISCDSQPYMPHVTAGRAGFFFSVTGIGASRKVYDPQFKTDIEIPRTLKFTGKNFSNQAKLLSYGHTPVFLEVTHDQYVKLMNGELPMFRQNWKRMTGHIEYTKT